MQNGLTGDDLILYLKTCYCAEKNEYIAGKGILLINSIFAKNEPRDYNDYRRENPLPDHRISTFCWILSFIITLIFAIYVMNIWKSDKGFYYWLTMLVVFIPLYFLLTGLIKVCLIPIDMLLFNKAFDKDELNRHNKYDEIEENKRKIIESYTPDADALCKMMKCCDDIKKQLYSYNIIYPKYQNFAAISQICEYFESGRCSELEGPSGAYNLYESELRQNIIIDKLDTIISQLDRIERNQYKIYDAICESNRILDDIRANTSVIAYTNECILEMQSYASYR